MRLSPWTLAAAASGFFPTLATPQGLAIDHAQVACVVAQQFPVLSARIDPAERVARARVYFRAAGQPHRPHWYSVEMKLNDSVYQGTLPRPRKGTAGIEYYIEVVDTATASTRTPEYAPAVVGSAAECSRAMAVAGATSVPSAVAVSAPRGASLVPAGFEANGIVAAGAAGAAVAATAVAAGAGGGGLGTTALVVGGVVVAGGAAAAVALGSAGGNDGNGNGGTGSGPNPQQCQGTVRIDERTATTLTVAWSGGQPTDGRYVLDSGAVPSGSACTVQSHDRSVVVQGTTFTITGLAPATTYSVHVHPAGTPCSTCTSGYNLVDNVGTIIATTLGP